MNGEAAAVLAIDGGNSKTEAALVTAAGRLVAHARGGPSNPQVLGTDGAVGVLREIVRAVACEAGIADGDRVADHAVACLAGADLPEEELHLTELVTAEDWSATALVVNDTFAVLRAGLEAGDAGIGVTCGAGINCVGAGPDGRTARFLGLGELSGDWGGSGDLAIAALWWAMRDEDGRGPSTGLRTVLPAHFGLSTMRDVTVSRHKGEISFEDLFELAPLILAVARDGDQVARDLVLRLADEICLMVGAVAERLGLADTAVPVVLGGSMLTARDRLLSERLADGLAARVPKALPRVVDVPPIVGAALLGLDRIGADPGSQARLRACYEQPGKGAQPPG